MYLITNGTVVTRNDGGELIDGGAVAFDGNTIVDCGKSAELERRYPDATRIDAHGRLVMPGFINAHEHYYSTFARGMSGGGRPATTFAEILRGLWWKLDKKLTLDDVYYSALPPMFDSIHSGVTTVIDHHASPCAAEGSLFTIAKAAAKTGLRSCLCYETSDRDGAEIKNAGIKENVEFAKHCKKENSAMLTALFGLHASLTISEKTLEECIGAAESADAGFHVHVAEGIEDVVDSLEKYDMRVVERLYKYKVLSEKSIAVHCIHITDEELEMLAASKAAVVHNPQSNMGNAVGAAPVLKMLKHGVLVGLGTDGYSASMLDSYKTAAIIHKHVAGIPSVAWAEPPLMLFKNNRAIAERIFKTKLGVLESGAAADIIIVDYASPTPVTKVNINSHILFGVEGRSVDCTIINGVPVMLERKLCNVDEGAELAAAREHASALWKR